MSHLADPGRFASGRDVEEATLQDAYDVGFEDGVTVGREMERDDIAKRLAADVGGRVDPDAGIVVRYPRQVGHSSWAEYKKARTTREQPGSGSADPGAARDDDPAQADR